MFFFTRKRKKHFVNYFVKKIPLFESLKLFFLRVPFSFLETTPLISNDDKFDHAPSNLKIHLNFVTLFPNFIASSKYR